MKKILAALLMVAVLTGAAFAGSSKIKITPPVVTDWSGMGGPYTTDSDPSGYLAALNSSIAGMFLLVQEVLNDQFIGNFHDLTELSRGFSNANMATFDNASLLGYQNYDLFAVTGGFNLGFALPSLDPSIAATALDDITTKGDLYAGLATGGFAVQGGLNMSFLVPHLYLTGKLGFIPTLPVNGVSYEQSMIGIGANYALMQPVDIMFGFLRWRGLSFGTGFTVNGNSVTADVPVPDQSKNQTINPGDGSTYNVTGKTSNTKVKLTVSNTSLVIPLDLMTSVQLLWFFNFGFGVGADMSFSSSNIKLAGASDVTIDGIEDVNAMTPGKVKLTATDSTGGGDFFVPRIAASLGLDLTVFKLDVPLSYYPTTKAFSFGITGGVVW